MASFDPLQDMFYGVYDNALRALEENQVFSQASGTISNMTEFQTHSRKKPHQKKLTKLTNTRTWSRTRWRLEVTDQSETRNYQERILTSLARSWKKETREAHYKGT